MLKLFKFVKHFYVLLVLTRVSAGTKNRRMLKIDTIFEINLRSVNTKHYSVFPG